MSSLEKNAQPPVKGKRPYRRKLSNYLLDKSLQLRYVAFVTLLSAVISGALGYMIWRQANQASDYLRESVAETFGHDIQEAVDDDVSDRDTDLVLTMGGVGVGLVVVLTLYLIIMTHKVAGPLYKVSSYFDKMAAGRLGDVWNLRKGDMLRDFYDKFKDMHTTVRERHKADNALIGRFLKACDDAGVPREGNLGERLDKLEQHHERRTEALS